MAGAGVPFPTPAIAVCRTTFPNAESSMSSEPVPSPDPARPPQGTAVPPTQGRPVRALGPLLALLCGFALLAYVLDQLTKHIVSSSMVEGEVLPALPPVLSWHYIRNSGAAFSIGENITWVFAVAMAVVAVVIVVMARKLGSRWWAIACGMLLGGALGNLTDRLLRPPYFGMGHVVDFIAVPHFAIFNVADSSIVGSVIIICILTLKGIPFGRTRPSRNHPADDSSTQPPAESGHD